MTRMSQQMTHGFDVHIMHSFYALYENVQVFSCLHYVRHEKLNLEKKPNRVYPWATSLQKVNGQGKQTQIAFLPSPTQ